MMIDWLKKRNSPNLNECIEEVFFRAMLIVGLIGCTVAVLFDLLITRNLAYIVPANMIGIQILLLALYAIRKVKFHRAAVFGLAFLNVSLLSEDLCIRNFIMLLASY